MKHYIPLFLMLSGCAGTAYHDPYSSSGVNEILAALEQRQSNICMDMARVARPYFQQGLQPVQWIALTKRAASPNQSISSRLMDQRVAYRGYAYRDLPDEQFEILMRAECDDVVR